MSNENVPNQQKITHQSIYHGIYSRVIQ